jgi:hypothetical protein
MPGLFSMPIDVIDPSNINNSRKLSRDFFLQLIKNIIRNNQKMAEL